MKTVDQIILDIIIAHNREGIDVKGSHVYLEGQPYALRLVPLKKRSTSEDKKEDKPAHGTARDLDMLLSVVASPDKPSRAFAEKGHQATSASGVLIGLKKRGLVVKEGKTWVLTDEGKFVVEQKHVES